MSEPEHFERALNALLAGDALEAGVDRASDDDPFVDALLVLSAIGRASRDVLFGESATARETTQWGHLEIREEIGRGTSGTVYRDRKSVV